MFTLGSKACSNWKGVWKSNTALALKPTIYAAGTRRNSLLRNSRCTLRAVGVNFVPCARLKQSPDELFMLLLQQRLDHILALQVTFGQGPEKLSHGPSRHLTTSHNVPQVALTTVKQSILRSRRDKCVCAPIWRFGGCVTVYPWLRVSSRTPVKCRGC